MQTQHRRDVRGRARAGSISGALCKAVHEQVRQTVRTCRGGHAAGDNGVRERGARATCGARAAGRAQTTRARVRGDEGLRASCAPAAGAARTRARRRRRLA
eukprot:6196099-Pleurochrysis_carterae.AAC.1